MGVRISARESMVSIPRFDGARDRIYSGFVTLENGAPMGAVKFVQGWEVASKHQDAYPEHISKKGLQVQMVDDAIKLGVKQAAFNFNISGCIALTPAPDDFRWMMDGRKFCFHRGQIEWLDHSVKALSKTGASVTLILLNYESGDPAVNKILLHPTYDHKAPNHLSAFNTSTPEGLAWFKAWVEFLADRYSAPGYPHGRIVNYIVGNEVDAHWEWANMGHVTMQQFAQDYGRTLRVAHTAVKKFSDSARVFISLEHHWNIRFAGGDKTQAFPGHPFVDYLNRLGKDGGDFDWNIAFHPYPEDLFNCKTWLDKTATYSDSTPRITFKNIEMLPRYLRREEMLFRENVEASPARSPKFLGVEKTKGTPRHVILSEQGFHSNPTAEGEKLQAAAYCYAWRKIVNLEGVDAFILHRHVDHSQEGGLNLGLWRREEGSVATPLSKKPIYEVFKAADTPEWEKAFEFALPVIGTKSWSEVNHKF